MPAPGAVQAMVYVWYWFHPGRDPSDVPVNSTRYISVPASYNAYEAEVNPPDDVYYFWVNAAQGTNWSLDCQRRS